MAQKAYSKCMPNWRSWSSKRNLQYRTQFLNWEHLMWQVTSTTLEGNKLKFKIDEVIVNGINLRFENRKSGEVKGEGKTKPDVILRHILSQPGKVPLFIDRINNGGTSRHARLRKTNLFMYSLLQNLCYVYQRWFYQWRHCIHRGCRERCVKFEAQQWACVSSRALIC